MKNIGKLPLKVLPVLTLMAAPLLADPAIALPGDPNFLCFRKYQSGQVENLERMCPRKAIGSGEIINRVRISKDAAKLLKFIQFSYDGKRLVAEVKNKTDKALSGLTINYNSYDRTSNGEAIVDTGTVPAQGRAIGAYGQTSFKAELDKSSDFVEITRVETDQSVEATMSSDKKRSK